MFNTKEYLIDNITQRIINDYNESILTGSKFTKNLVKKRLQEELRDYDIEQNID